MQWQDSLAKDLWPAKARAATKIAICDIIQTLVDGAQELDQTPTAAVLSKSLGKLMGNKVREEIDQILSEISSEEDKRFRIAMADHFWCEFFAAIAKLASDVNTSLDSIPENVTDLVLDLRESDRRNVVRNKVSPSPRRIGPRQPLEHYLVQRVVNAALNVAWEPVKHTYDQALVPLTLHARIMAVLVCPAPERHWEVAEHCMVPLFKQYIVEPTIKRLEATLCLDFFRNEPSHAGPPDPVAPSMPA